VLVALCVTPDVHGVLSHAVLPGACPGPRLAGPPADVRRPGGPGISSPRRLRPVAATRAKPGRHVQRNGGDCLTDDGSGVTEAGIVGLPKGFALQAGTPTVVATAISYALAQVGKPYVWGGTGPAGYDCSGLVLSPATPSAYRHLLRDTPPRSLGHPVNAQAAALTPDMIIETRRKKKPGGATSPSQRGIIRARQSQRKCQSPAPGSSQCHDR
jgi:NlpC/P60 family